MARPPVSVTIITLNEEPKIAQAIRSVSWADEVLVVDSGSTDGTVAVAQKMGARVISNPWPGYGQQKNFAQQHAAHDWVLNLDGDEAVSPELAREIQDRLEDVAQGKLEAAAFRMPRRTYYIGRWIRYGGWYPNFLTRLADRRHSSWSEPHVHEDLVTRGPVATLTQALDHYAFDSIDDQIRTNMRYALLGSQELRRRGKRPSLARLVYKPLGKFVETYIIKRGFLDGLRGFIISVNAAHSIFLKYAHLFELKTKESDYADPDHR